MPIRTDTTKSGYKLAIIKDYKYSCSLAISLNLINNSQSTHGESVQGTLRATMKLYIFKSSVSNKDNGPVLRL